MSDLESIAISLFVAFLGGEIVARLKYPRVLGQLVISLVFGIPAISNTIFTPQSLNLVGTLSELGVIFLLFITGFEINIDEFVHNKRDSAIISFSAAIVPFLMGFAAGWYFWHSILTGVVLGGALSVTAEGTKAALLLELHKIKTRVASIMLEAGVLDDFFEILFLALVLFFSHQQGESLGMLGIRMLLFIIIIALFFRYVPKAVHFWERHSNEQSLFTSVLLFGLGTAVISEWVGIGSVIGALVAGVILQRSFSDDKKREEVQDSLQMLAFSFIVPFFFINVGLHFDYSAIQMNPEITLIILLIAILGKIGGTMITKPFVSLRWKQLYLIGWGMNSRGVMELVIAQIALAGHLISPTLYSMIVFVAIITTVIFPFFLKTILQKDSSIME